MPKQKKFSVFLIILLTFIFTTKAEASLTFNNSGITGDASFNTLTIPGISTSGCLTINSSGVVSSTGVACGGGGGTWGSITGTLSAQSDLNTALNAKQATLVSGTNIKTVNSNNILGSGDLTVGTLIGFTPENTANKATDFSTVNNTLYPTVQAAKAYTDSKVLGLLNYRGGFDASSNIFPTVGSGTAGAVMKGDTWVISTGGTMGGTAIQAGDSIIANIDSPGTSAGWNTINTNIAYVPENSTNKVTSISGASTDTQYPSAKLLFDQLALKGTGTVTSVSIAGGNGFAGSSSGGATPALTISTSITGLLKGNGTSILAATGADLPAMTATVGGAVPTPPNNTTTFLRGDGTFAVPAGGGDMVLASVQTITGAKTFGTIGGAVGKFILAGSTSGSTILNASAIAGSTTITLPATTGTLLLDNGSAASLTSFPTFNQDTTGKSAKTDALNSATTVVNVSSATAPSTGQVLTATDSTHATWQTASGGSTAPFTTVTDASPIAWALGSVPIVNGIATLNHLTPTRVLNITGPVNGGEYTLEIVQDSTGGATLTLGTGCTWKIVNGGSGAIVVSAAPNAIDILSFIYDGVNCVGTFTTNYN